MQRLSLCLVPILFALGGLIQLAQPKIIIHSPERLVDMFAVAPNKTTKESTSPDYKPPGIIEVSYANFGFIPYGHKINGRLYFDVKHDKVCQPVKPGEIELFDDLEYSTPFMLADRGGCSFVTKVRNIENLGMAVAVVVDNHSEDVNNIIMSDDGTGAGLRIPSMLISKKDGDKLVDFMKTATVEELQQINVIISFEKINVRHQVDYDVWYSSSNDLALDFLSNFAYIDARFKDKVRMTPRFVFWECVDCDKKFLDEHCYGAGKYCASEFNDAGITGREIVLEDVRQYCIYQQTYFTKDVNDRKKWWDYIKAIHQECGSVVNEYCSKFAHKEVAGLSWDVTDKCVANSFSTPDKTKWHLNTTSNSIIDENISYWLNYGSNIYPSIMINNVTFRGQMETQAVMNAICAGFDEVPTSCKKILSAKDFENNLNVGVVWYDDGYTIDKVVYILIFFVVVLLCTLCCYRRYAKRQMKKTMDLQIETAVSMYRQLNQRDNETETESFHHQK